MNTTPSITRGAASEDKMRRRSDALAQQFAKDIAPLMPLARRAYGQQKQGTTARTASDAVNELLLEYDQQGGNVTQLAEELDGVITLAGLRRRLRVARAGTQLGQKTDRAFRGNRDPELIHAAAEKIRASQGTDDYGVQLRLAYDAGLALSALAQELEVSYFTAWSSMSTSAAAAKAHARAVA